MPNTVTPETGMVGMPAHTEISTTQLLRLIGLPACPVLIDVRTDEDVATDPRILPASRRRSPDQVGTWGLALAGRPVVTVCQAGGKLAQGTAAWLRHLGVQAESLEGGFEAWRAAGGPLVPLDVLPAVGMQGATRWVTRSRPKVDRTACPWLIRRFVDPEATFLFVPASEVAGVAERFAATPFDVEGTDWSHRGELCTFDLMVERFGLASPAMLRLATIIRGADTARLDIAPQAAGFLAIALGLSRMYRDDLEQVEASMLVYDALYRWCRDATEETHNWPGPGQRGAS